MRAVEAILPAAKADALVWHVLHTKSRQEKSLAADLAALKIDHFLPLVKQVKYYGNRKAKVELPLFPGYLFLKGTIDQAYLADRTDRVAQIIKVADQKHLDWELSNLQKALAGDAPLDPYPYLAKGVKVEVRAGPFRGLQGVIENRARPDRLLLQIDLVAKSASLEIDGALLEPIE